MSRDELEFTPTGLVCRVTPRILDGSSPVRQIIRERALFSGDTGWLLTEETGTDCSRSGADGALVVDVGRARLILPELDHLGHLPVGSRVLVETGTNGRRNLDIRLGIPLGGAARGYPYPYGPEGQGPRRQIQAAGVSPELPQLRQSGAFASGIVLAAFGFFFLFSCIPAVDRAAKAVGAAARSQATIELVGSAVPGLIMLATGVTILIVIWIRRCGQRAAIARAKAPE